MPKPIHPSRVTPTTRFHVTGVQPKQSHTPGPWTVFADHPRFLTTRTGQVVARTFPTGKGYQPEEAANARLIAAAPDLLALVQRMVAPGAPLPMDDARALLSRLEA